MNVYVHVYHRKCAYLYVRELHGSMYIYIEVYRCIRLNIYVDVYINVCNRICTYRDMLGNKAANNIHISIYIFRITHIDTYI